mmetsp:Transcript_42594/g.120825  ORF Transcript_42594/g.120825 Transcript_42594/m.120825 type:complete len:315 (+) Transcript_42594:516-1460(+)
MHPRRLHTDRPPGAQCSHAHTNVGTRLSTLTHMTHSQHATSTTHTNEPNPSIPPPSIHTHMANLWMGSSLLVDVLLQHCDHVPGSRSPRNAHGRLVAVLGGLGGRHASLQQRTCADRQVVGRHAVQWRVTVCVDDIGVSALVEEELCHELVPLAHAAHVQRPRAARRLLLESRRRDGQNLLDRLLALAQRLDDRRITPTCVHGSGVWVVVLILSAVDDLAFLVLLDFAAIDARADSVGIRVKSLRISVALCAVVLGHSLGIRVMLNPHAVLPVILARRRTARRHPGECCAGAAQAALGGAAATGRGGGESRGTH